MKKAKRINIEKLNMKQYLVLNNLEGKFKEFKNKISSKTFYSLLKEDKKHCFKTVNALSEHLGIEFSFCQKLLANGKR